MSPNLVRTQVEVTESTRMITAVSKPTIPIYRPAKATKAGPGILICQGGWYWYLYWQREGEEVATWLNSFGGTGIALKYRVPRRRVAPKSEPFRRQLPNAQRVSGLIRSKAIDGGINP